MLEVFGGGVRLTRDVRVRVGEGFANEWLDDEAIQPAEPSREVPEAEDCIATNIDVWVSGQSSAEALSPLEIFGVERRSHWHVEQFARFVAHERGFRRFLPVERDRLVFQS